MKGRKVKNS